MTVSPGFELGDAFPDLVDVTGYFMSGQSGRREGDVTAKEMKIAVTDRGYLDFHFDFIFAGRVQCHSVLDNQWFFWVRSRSLLSYLMVPPRVPVILSYPVDGTHVQGNGKKL